MAEHAQIAAQQAAPAAPPAPATRKMVAVLSGVAAFSGLLIVGVFQFTLPFIDANREAMIERAIFTVVPGGAEKRVFGYTDDGVQPDPAGASFGERFYAVYDEAGALQGVALEASGQGYQDVIRILYGFDPEREVVTGMTVLESRETPGLGDKIGKDPEFLENFEALDAEVDPATNTPEHEIVTVKHGEKENPWEIDGITGATISSVAIGDMIDAGLRRDLPRLLPHLDDLRKAPS